MKVEVEVISKESIKPSSPTPDHLRHYSLSYIDQITPQIFMPLLLFYPNLNLSKVELHDRIKNSLSEALTEFYPLAGQVKDNLFVDCNDEGVPYLEAEAKCNISEFLENPIPGDHNKFLPYELDDVNALEIPAAVQVTFFNGGGIVIGLLFNHKVSDAQSFFIFLNSWAAIARGDRNNTVTPRFVSATLFPPEPLSGSSPNGGSTAAHDNLVVKRFVFDASAIAALRAKYSTGNTDIEHPRPTRFEALSAFIWSRLVAATEPKEEPSNKVYAVVNIVNIRTRMEPPLSENYFGNLSLFTLCFLSRDTEHDGFSGIVVPVRDTIKKANVNFVNEVRESGGMMNFIGKKIAKFAKEVIGITFTSLCRFPVYEADFGWGKPVWVASAKLLYKNLITFFDTKEGDGIEVWINLEEEEMAKFETDEEVLKYVSLAKNSVM